MKVGDIDSNVCDEEERNDYYEPFVDSSYPDECMATIASGFAGFLIAEAESELPNVKSPPAQSSDLGL